jgi:hypothetical protein
MSCAHFPTLLDNTVQLFEVVYSFCYRNIVGIGAHDEPMIGKSCTLKISLLRQPISERPRVSHNLMAGCGF